MFKQLLKLTMSRLLGALTMTFVINIKLFLEVIDTQGLS